MDFASQRSLLATTQLVSHESLCNKITHMVNMGLFQSCRAHTACKSLSCTAGLAQWSVNGADKHKWIRWGRLQLGCRGPAGGVQHGPGELCPDRGLPPAGCLWCLQPPTSSHGHTPGQQIRPWLNCVQAQRRLWDDDIATLNSLFEFGVM